MSVISLVSVAQTSVWKVTKNGKTLYLGGSVHLLRKTDYPLPKEFDAAFEQANTVVFETDIKKLKDTQFTQKLMMQGVYSDGNTLQKVLSEKVYNELKEECQKLSIPLTALNNFKPSMVMLMLMMAKVQKLGVSEEGVDKYYYQKSEEGTKKTLALETVEYQMKVLMNMGDGNENKYVKYSLKSFDDMEKDLTALITTWKDGSSSVMKRQLKEMKADYPQVYQDLMVTRNNNWLPQIEKFMLDEPIELVLVGALHLHGADGLLKQLEKKGYTVTQYVK